MRPERGPSQLATRSLQTAPENESGDPGEPGAASQDPACFGQKGAQFCITRMGTPSGGSPSNNQLTKQGSVIEFTLFGWQYVSSAGFPTPTSLASAARIIFVRLDEWRVFPYVLLPLAGA